MNDKSNPIFVVDDDHGDLTLLKTMINRAALTHGVPAEADSSEGGWGSSVNGGFKTLLMF